MTLADLIARTESEDDKVRALFVVAHYLCCNGESFASRQERRAGRNSEAASEVAAMTELKDPIARTEAALSAYDNGDSFALRPLLPDLLAELKRHAEPTRNPHRSINADGSSEPCDCSWAADHGTVSADVSDLLARCDAALEGVTPGPWTGPYVLALGRAEDRGFIASARTLLPELRDEVRRLRERSADIAAHSLTEWAGNRTSE